MTDLIERVETTRFLGSEFLLWLWFTADQQQGHFNFGNTEIEVWFDSQLQLRSASDSQERVTLVGVEPSAGSEAKAALLSNKLPTRARLGLRWKQLEYSFTFDAETFGFLSIKFLSDSDPHDNDPRELLAEERPPTKTSDPDPDVQIADRMDRLAELDEAWRALYAEFLNLRVSKTWDKTTLPELRRWATR